MAVSSRAKEIESRSAAKAAAIIVAAGKGTRMGGDQDKLFLEVAGLPVVAHTWQSFDRIAAIEEIVLVVRDGLQGTFLEIGRRCGLSKPFRFAVGGAQRQDSVWNGLQALSEEAKVVAIQDGARPCTSVEIIEKAIHMADDQGAAVVAERVSDTIKESIDRSVISRHLNRSHLWAVQTPQCFRVAVIQRALEAVREREIEVTDDTAACELIDQPVHLVPNPSPNPKLTRPEDLPYLELLLKGGGVAG